MCKSSTFLSLTLSYFLKAHLQVMRWLVNSIGALALLCTSVGCSEEEQPYSNSCPNQFWVDASMTGLGCLLFNSTTSYSWERANDYCQTQENATLLEIWTELQLDFVQNELIFLTDHEESRDWWTSGTDQGREGHWYWASSLSPVADFVWNEDQPDSMNGGQQQNCLAPFNTSLFRGHDMNCDLSDDNQKPIFPICQKK